MKFKANHQAAATKARVEYDSFLARLAERKFGRSQAEIYIYGTVIRTNETLESMFHNATAAPDNTLNLLFRHVLENTARVRYLAQAPCERVKVFEIAEMESRLRIIGREKRNGEPSERQGERARIIEIQSQRTAELREMYGTPENKKLPKISIEVMCVETGDESLYDVYRLFSQFEHSTGVGLMGTVVDAGSGQFIHNKCISKDQARLLWEGVEGMIFSIEQALDMLDTHRPL